MKIIKTPSLSSAQKETICYLWNREYPKQLAVTRETFDQYLATSTGHFHLLVVDDAGEVAGWAYSFNRDGERWFSIILNSLYQRIGLGSRLLQLLKEKESSLCGWVIDHANDVRQNGEPYESPLPFYIRNGFSIIPGVRYEDEKMSAAKIRWKKDQ